MDTLTRGLLIAAFLGASPLFAACAGLSFNRKALAPLAGWSFASVASFACAMLSATAS